MYGWTGMLNQAGYNAMKLCVAAILGELANANIAWHEYPTLVDAIEQHVEMALLTPNMQVIVTTEGRDTGGGASR